MTKLDINLLVNQGQMYIIYYAKEKVILPLISAVIQYSIYIDITPLSSTISLFVHEFNKEIKANQQNQLMI